MYYLLIFVFIIILCTMKLHKYTCLISHSSNSLWNILLLSHIHIQIYKNLI